MAGFREVARTLRRQILDGEYAPGARLPSEADLAKRFGCSRDTVRDAMAILTYEGHVVSRRGFLSSIRPRLTRIVVELPPNATVTARPMSLDEAEQIGCGRGVSMLEVHTFEGGVCSYRADLYTFTTGGRNLE
ncbi:GntR family transcriptional regulator [Dactylosporangium sp. CA-139066]|uniref:GntR family transcriptional regulator n=1 Tax=Dactylosporangium sp. CA-139066 TaxID=3239930 RepID=UPI003D8FA0C3